MWWRAVRAEAAGRDPLRCDRVGLPALEAQPGRARPGSRHHGSFLGGGEQALGGEAGGDPRDRRDKYDLGPDSPEMSVTLPASPAPCATKSTFSPMAPEPHRCDHQIAKPRVNADG